VQQVPEIGGGTERGTGGAGRRDREEHGGAAAWPPS
jgi:hypothetical protein